MKGFCIECGDLINKLDSSKADLETARTCADDPLASVWQDAEYACPSIKRKWPWVAPYIRRIRLAALFGRIEGLAQAARISLEDEAMKPDLEGILFSIENQMGWIRAKITPPRKPLVSVVKDSLTTQPAAKPSNPNPLTPKGGEA